MSFPNQNSLKLLAVHFSYKVLKSCVSHNFWYTQYFYVKFDFLYSHFQTKFTPKVSQNIGRFSKTHYFTSHYSWMQLSQVRCNQVKLGATETTSIKPCISDNFWHTQYFYMKFDFLDRHFKQNFLLKFSKIVDAFSITHFFTLHYSWMQLSQIGCNQSATETNCIKLE